MNPRDFIRIARQLASGAVGERRGRPRQAELRRAVSAAYYALFYLLAGNAADLLAGARPSARNRQFWMQTYRAVEHRQARNQCLNKAVMRGFPPEIQYLGETFANMQTHRHDADYNPQTELSRSQVMRLIDSAERAIDGFDRVPAPDRRAFALHILLRARAP